MLGWVSCIAIAAWKDPFSLLVINPVARPLKSSADLFRALRSIIYLHITLNTTGKIKLHSEAAKLYFVRVHVFVRFFLQLITFLLLLNQSWLYAHVSQVNEVDSHRLIGLKVFLWQTHKHQGHNLQLSQEFLL